VRDLAGGNFIASSQPRPVGGTGTGKTHLASPSRRSCIRAGSRGRFFTLSTWSIGSRPKGERVARDGLPIISLVWNFVVLDELGYLPSPRPAGSSVPHRQPPHERTSVHRHHQSPHRRMASVFGDPK